MRSFSLLATAVFSNSESCSFSLSAFWFTTELLIL